MIIYIIVIIVYLSFLLDFLVWPIPSEASTYSIINRNVPMKLIYKFFLILVFVISLLFYITPLCLSFYYLFTGYTQTVIPKDILGIVISVIGRLITVIAANKLRNNSAGLVSDSLFKYSRNPISLGLHVTIAGLLIIFGNWYLWSFFIIYLLNIHYKIKIEENRLYQKYGSVYEFYRAKTPRYLIMI